MIAMATLTTLKEEDGCSTRPLMRLRSGPFVNSDLTHLANLTHLLEYGVWCGTSATELHKLGITAGGLRDVTTRVLLGIKE